MGAAGGLFKPFIYEDSLEPRGQNAFVTKYSNMYSIVFRPFACRKMCPESRVIRNRCVQTLSLGFLLLGTVVMLVGVYKSIFLLNATLGFRLLFLVPVMILWQRTAVNAESTESRTIASVGVGQLNESIQGAGIVQAFQQEEKIVVNMMTSLRLAEVGRKELILDSYFSWSLVSLLVTLRYLELCISSGCNL